MTTVSEASIWSTSRVAQHIADYTKYSDAELQILDTQTLTAPIHYLGTLVGAKGNRFATLWHAQLTSELTSYPILSNAFLSKVQAATTGWRTRVWDERLAGALPVFEGPDPLLAPIQGPLKEGETASDRLRKIACFKIEMLYGPPVTLLGTFEPDIACSLLLRATMPILSDAMARWKERLESIAKEKEADNKYNALSFEALTAEHASYQDLIASALTIHPHRKLVSRHLRSEYAEIDGLFNKHRAGKSLPGKPPLARTKSLHTVAIPDQEITIADGILVYPTRRRASRQSPGRFAIFCAAISQTFWECVKYHAACANKSEAQYRVSPEQVRKTSSPSTTPPGAQRSIAHTPPLSSRRLAWTPGVSSPTASPTSATLPTSNSGKASSDSDETAVFEIGDGG